MLLGLKPDLTSVRWRPTCSTASCPARNLSAPKSWPCIRKATNTSNSSVTSRMASPTSSANFGRETIRRSSMTSSTLSFYHRVHEVYDGLSFEDALCEVIRRIGPIKANTLRFYVSRAYEELVIALKALEQDGRISRVTTLVPEPEDFYCAPEEVGTFRRLGERTGRCAS